MSRIVILSLSIFTLFACGGGDSSLTSIPPSQPVVPPVTPPTTPVTGVAAPVFPPNLSVTTCTGLYYLDALSVQSDDATPTGFEADNAIDDNLSATNRWETTASGAQLTIELGYRHLVKEIGTAWFEGDQRISTFDIALSEDGATYTTVLSNESSGGITESLERFDIPNTVARFVRIISAGDNIDNTTSLIEAAVLGCPLDVTAAPIQTKTVDLSQFNLDPTASPGENFDLLTWALDTPRTDPDDGFSLRASERELDQGFTDSDYFYTAADGGMVFRATIFGATTSANTRFTRSELREMLRRGNTGISTQGANSNNWILGYQPDPQRQVGGRGGLLQATLKIDQVTTTGSESHTGRLVIGQIHAGTDEPIRLYFKKFPNNDRGYIYFAHEINGGDDIWKVVVGQASSNEDNQPITSNNPEQGIALGEIFSYEINQQGPRIDVVIRRGDLNGPIIGHQYVDMNEENSGYDVLGGWNYFKAGAYSQNNTGNSGDANGVGSDFDLVTFYYLSNTHSPQ